MAKYVPVNSEEPVIEESGLEEPAPEYAAFEIEEPAESSVGSVRPLTDAELYKRLPKANATGLEVIEWLNLLLAHRGESIRFPPVGLDRDLRFLLGSDLQTMNEEELRALLPTSWPEELRMVIAKDIQRHVSKREVDAQLLDAVTLNPSLNCIIYNSSRIGEAAYDSSSSCSVSSRYLPLSFPQ